MKSKNSFNTQMYSDKLMVNWTPFIVDNEVMILPCVCLFRVQGEQVNEAIGLVHLN